MVQVVRQRPFGPRWCLLHKLPDPRRSRYLYPGKRQPLNRWLRNWQPQYPDFRHRRSHSCQAATGLDHTHSWPTTQTNLYRCLYTNPDSQYMLQQYPHYRLRQNQPLQPRNKEHNCHQHPLNPQMCVSQSSRGRHPGSHRKVHRRKGQ